MSQKLSKVITLFMTLALLTTAATSAVLAAPAAQDMMACAQDYSVQADDWLSKLAEKQYGDMMAYPTIVEATNEAAQSDSSYATISNPNVIEVGWKLCLPATADAGMMADSMAMEGDSMAMEEDSMAMEEDSMAMEEDSVAMEEDSMAMEEGMMDESMEMMGEQTSFSVRIENVAAESGLVSPLAPGVWAIHTTADLFFASGQPDRRQGLEALAEDGDPSGLAAAAPAVPGVVNSGVFNTPVGAGEPGPLSPGQTYEFSFEAAPGESLSFATMLVQSNDLFFAPDGTGIALFDASGQPVTGDVTAQVSLWDAGTEVNQAPGAGPDQAPRQAGPDTGAAENGVVQPVSDAFTYPDTADLILVTISSGQ